MQLNKKPPIADTLRRGETNDSDKARRKPPLPFDGGSTSSNTNNYNSNNSGSSSNKRLSGSLSSSSLARLVATSGLDIYEKYSPAHYKPNSELSTSSSRSSLIDNADSSNNTASTSNNSKNNSNDETTTHFTLDRPRSSRYSRLYSLDSASTTTNNATTSTLNTQNNKNYNSNTTTNNNNNNNDVDAVDFISSRSRSSSRRGTGKLLNSSSASGTAGGLSISQSSSSSDVPTATFTLRNNRLSAKAKDSETDGEVSVSVKNGVVGSDSSNGLDPIAVRKQLKELKLSNSSSALNAESKDEDVSYIKNNGTSDVEVSLTATLKLDDNVNGTLNKSSSSTDNSKVISQVMKQLQAH